MTDNRTSSARKLVKVATTLTVIGLTALGWMQLAPPFLGGRTSYAVITGNSMEPMLHGGDLAIIRRADSYREGDVAAYNSKDLHNLVLHRVVGSENGRLVTKGDNNDFVDPEQPVPDQFVGRLWVRIPRAGTYLAKLRDPRIAALPAAIVALIAFGAFTRGPRRRKSSAVPQHLRVRDARVSEGPRGRKVALASAAGLFVLSAGIGSVGFTRPAQSSFTRSAGYLQNGSFSYTAAVDRGSVYDTATVRTGEPVYLRVAKDLDIAFDYSFESDAPAQVGGEGSMSTTLAASNGWSRTVAQTAPVEIENGAVHLEQNLQVEQLQQLVETIQTETGVSETYYTLAFSADVAPEGEIAGRSIDESFSAQMPFQLDSFQLRLDTGSEDGVAADPTNTTDKGSVATEQISTGRVQAGSFAIDIQALRIASIVGAALAILLGALALYLSRGTESDEPKRIEARYTDLIVRARSIDHPGWASAIELEDFDAVRKISDAYETMILHGATDEAVFLTIHENQIYFARVEDSNADVVTPRLVALPLRDRVTFIEDLAPSIAGAPE